MAVATLELLRTQFGAAIRHWSTGPGGYYRLADDHWVMLSGVPSTDGNLALVHTDDPSTLTAVSEAITGAGLPAVLSVTDEVDTKRLPSEWQHVGSMPFMALSLATADVAADPRVRLTTAYEGGIVTALLTEAYGLDHEVSQAFVDITYGRDDHDMQFWLLYDEGMPVSVVLTAPVDDVVTVWCMGTPARVGRRGYGRALLGHVLHEARTAGARIGLLGATAAGKPLYESTGWRTVEEWRLIANASSVQFEH